MTVEDIIKQVRWCIDEEETNDTLFNASDTDNVFMNNIIRNKITDALRWCALYASTILKGANDSSSTATDFSLLRTYELTAGPTKKDDGTSYDTEGVITLSESAIRVVRVKVEGWHKAIRTGTLIAEDSDEYLALSDDTSTATAERPVAALIETYPLQVETYPKGESVSITVAVEPGNIDFSGKTETEINEMNIEVPLKLQTSMVYYIAFLVLSAYNDTAKAQQMLGIAKMSIGGVVNG